MSSFSCRWKITLDTISSVSSWVPEATHRKEWSRYLTKSLHTLSACLFLWVLIVSYSLSREKASQPRRDRYHTVLHNCVGWAGEVYLYVSFLPYSFWLWWIIITWVQETGAKIAIRGKGAVKDGKVCYLHLPHFPFLPPSFPCTSII